VENRFSILTTNKRQLYVLLTRLPLLSSALTSYAGERETEQSSFFPHPQVLTEKTKQKTVGLRGT
jgi:hypothetical protein